MRSSWLLVSIPLVLLTGSEPRPRVPELLTGIFEDDYGITHQISDTSWALGSRDRYRIVLANDSAQYLVLQNAPGNTADGGKWTRIDWMTFSGMPPWEWGFCMIEYKAATQAQAVANATADRTNPRKGCNGYPFSRMRRVQPAANN